MNEKDSVNRQIIIPLYHFTQEYTRYRIYILPQGTCSVGHVLITYNIDGEINHNQSLYS
jgi:hypothetical protein